MVASLTAFATVGIALVAFGARLGRRAFLVAAVVPAAVTVWLASQLGRITGGSVVQERVEWVEGLRLSVDLRLDGLALTMSLIITTRAVQPFSAAHAGARNSRNCA